jgi:putative phosphoribosyl transferase
MGYPEYMRFRDRAQAGSELARKLQSYQLSDPIVLALPRGGVPVGFKIAAALRAPLEVFVARKVGAPGHEELGIAAIAEGSDELVIGEAARQLGIGRHEIEKQAAREREELRRRVSYYRRNRPLPDVAGRDVIVVDDGLATGVTAEAAMRALRQRRPRRLLLAVPVCARDTASRLDRISDDVVCLSSPADFLAVGFWYEDFSQTSDEEVLALLDQARAAATGSPVTFDD